MTPDSIHQLIGHALVDPNLRQALLAGQDEAFRAFDFSEDERRRIRSVQASSLQRLAAELLEWDRELAAL